MRKLVHLSLVACLLSAFGQAPFAHTHVHDPDHEHATGLAHTHGLGGPSDHSGWTADDHGSDARPEEWVIASGKAPINLDVILADNVVSPDLRPVAAARTEPSPHNHDPPWLDRLQSRAPPA